MACIKDKRKWIANRLKIATWNVRGIANKEEQLARIFRNKGISIGVATETKKKMQGSKYVEEYIMLYSGVKPESRASKGVAIYINRTMETLIKSYEFISERIITVSFKLDRGTLTIIGAYAPEEGKKQDSTDFYDLLQKTLNKNASDQVIILGDLNARIGNRSIPNIVGTCGENTINDNGHRLREFATYNQLKITNSFFRKKEIHKYTWTARGYRSIIDYVIVNNKLAGQVTDTRVYRGSDVGSDHYLLISDIALYTKWKKTHIYNTRKKDEEVFKVHLLENNASRQQYQDRLSTELENKETSSNIEIEWNNLKKCIQIAALETIGTKRKHRRKKGIKIWSPEIEAVVKEKQKAYEQYLNNPSEENKEAYKIKRNFAKTCIRTAHQTSWDKFINRIEEDVHGRQTLAYKTMKMLNSSNRETVRINTIEEKQWLNAYKALWYDSTVQTENATEVDTRGLDDITIDEVLYVLKDVKNRKAPGMDGINMELLKHGGIFLHLRLQHIFNMCWKKSLVPDCWQKAKVIPIYKKGERNNCENYRGISLLDTCYKLYARILNNRLRNIANNLLGEEQMGFRKGRSTTDAIFTVKLLIEKQREFNNETHIAFIDFEKAFDSVKRNKLWNILERRGYPMHLIRAIKSLYHNTSVVIDVNGNTSDEIVTNKGVRQGCCISSTLFNIYLDDAIRRWKNHIDSGIQLDKDTILNVLLYADDLALFQNTEDNLQKSIYTLHNICQEYDLRISTKKTKTMAFVGKYPVRTKICISNENIEQVSHFKYLGSDISYDPDWDIEEKLNTFRKVCGTINRHLRKSCRKDTLLKFYKTIAVPTVMYGSETWVVNKRQEKHIQAAEMKFLRSVKGCRITDLYRNDEIREELQIFKLQDKIKDNKIRWCQHLERMEMDRLPRRIQLFNPRGKRSLGRPRKRWVPEQANLPTP